MNKRFWGYLLIDLGVAILLATTLLTSWPNIRNILIITPWIIWFMGGCFLAGLFALLLGYFD